MDAREKWLERGDALLVEAINSQYHLGQMSGGNCVTMQQAIPSELAFDAIRAHLRTTPEGFALVPVPEWVPVGERLPVVPNGEDYAEVWVVVRGEVREDAFGQQISEDGMSLECGSGFCSDGVTHWKYKYTPAPPEEA